MIKIVICGSKAFKDKCIEIADDLQKININAIVFIKVKKYFCLMIYMNHLKKN